MITSVPSNIICLFFYFVDPGSIQLQYLLLTPGFLKLSDTVRQDNLDRF